jgi:hypothetical protein
MKEPRKVRQVLSIFPPRSVELIQTVKHLSFSLCLTKMTFEPSLATSGTATGTATNLKQDRR